jgi:hypothetical protein
MQVVSDGIHSVINVSLYTHGMDSVKKLGGGVFYVVIGIS